MSSCDGSCDEKSVGKRIEYGADAQSVFVLFCFAWFAVALIGRFAQVDLGFDLWYSLWEPVIMPAIGILMAGALVSGLSNWVGQKFLKDSP